MSRGKYRISHKRMMIRDYIYDFKLHCLVEKCFHRNWSISRRLLKRLNSESKYIGVIIRFRND